LDGYEATKAIRRDEDANVRDILVIALTASAIRGDREKCLEAGMNDYLAKPVRQTALKTMIDEYLAKPVNGLVREGEPADGTRPSEHANGVANYEGAKPENKDTAPTKDAIQATEPESPTAMKYIAISDTTDSSPNTKEPAPPADAKSPMVNGNTKRPLSRNATKNHTRELSDVSNRSASPTATKASLLKHVNNVPLSPDHDSSDRGCENGSKV
jgi:hypothetical protein